MFRRLRERLAEEIEAQATRFPGGQHAFNNSPGGRSTDSTSKSQDENSMEDLITLSDSPSVVVPHTSPQQFSIGDDDGFPSETSTPQRTQANNSDTDQYYTPSSSEQQSATSLTEGQNILPTYTPSRKTYYVPQSDIESEVEEPPTLKLDVSMDQLCAANELLQAKLYKYKDKYSKVVQVYREMHEEKKKIEHTLTDCQDKALRRIAELKEQCQLEQKAKAHLEENLRIYLEEKEEMINVLQTKIGLLKEGRNTDAIEVPVPKSDTYEDRAKSESLSELANQALAMTDKVKKLQVLLEKCKDTIVSNKDQMTALQKEKENMLQMLEAKSKELEDIKGRDGSPQSEVVEQLQNLKSRLIELEQQQAESAMSMAETKKNMHEELEIKEQQLSKAKEDIKQLQHSVEEERHASVEMKKQHEETIAKLQDKLNITEKLMEEEKQNLMQELSRGKAAAVALMQQECAKKLHAVEAEWKEKLRECGVHSEKTLLEKEKEFNQAVAQKDIELQNLQYDLDKEKIVAEELERQNEKLGETIQSVRDDSMHESELHEKMKCLKADYARDIEEKHLLISSLESDKNNLQVELDNLISKSSGFQSEIMEVQQSIVQLKEELKNSESMICEKDVHIEDLNGIIRNAEESLRKTFGFASAKADLSLEQHTNSGSHNTLNQLLCDNDNVVKLMLKYNCEMKEKMNALLKEKESVEEKFDIMISSFSKTKETLSNTEFQLRHSQDQYDKLTQDLEKKSGHILILQEAQQHLELENSRLHQKHFELEEKFRVLQQNENLVKELECKLGEEMEKGIKNASKHSKLLHSFLNTVQQLEDELHISASGKHTKNHELQNRCENEEHVSSKGHCNDKEPNTDYVLPCNELEEILCERLTQVVVLCKTLKSHENEIFHLKSEIKKGENMNNEMRKKVDESENLRSKMVTEKESALLEISKLHELLSSAEEKKTAFCSNIQELSSCLEEVKCKLNSTEEENKNLVEELKSFNDLKLQNESLMSELDLLKNTSDSKFTSYISEISCLQQSLMKVEEERNNLSEVLISIEQEIGLNNNSSTCATEKHTLKDFPCSDQSDADYAIRFEKMKALIKDLQYRETEQSNLLEKTRNDYENQIKQINMKVQDEIKTLNSLTERSSNEIKCLKEQFADSLKEYEDKIEHLNNKLNSKSDELTALTEDLSSKQAHVVQLDKEVEQLKNTLAAKEALVSVLCSDKNDLERKIVEMKENFEHQEYELKSHHNHILTTLRDQTKQTIESLNAQIKEFKELSEDETNKSELLIAEIKTQHQVEIEDIKSELKRLESDKKCIVDAEKKIEDLQSHIDAMAIQLEESNLEKELFAKEKTIEWETKSMALSLQISSLSVKHKDECRALQSKIDLKEKHIKKCKASLCTINLQLQFLRAKLMDLSAKFDLERQKHKLNMQQLANWVKQIEPVARELQNVSDTKNDLVHKIAALQKLNEENEMKWENKISKVRQKFIFQLKNQQEKHGGKLQELQLLMTENSILKSAFKEKESTLNQVENSVQELHTQVCLKDQEIEAMKYALVQKEEAISCSTQEKEDFSKNFRSIENEISSLKQIFVEFQNLHKCYASDELSPATLSTLLTNLSVKCSDYKKKCTDLENLVSSLKSDISNEFKAKNQCVEEMKNDMNSMMKEIDNLQEQFSSLKKCNEELLIEKEKHCVESKEIISKLKIFEDESSKRENNLQKRICNLASENKRILKEKQLVQVEYKKKFADLKKSAEVKLEVIKRETCLEKNQATQLVTVMYEDELAELKNKIIALASEKEIFENQVQANSREKVAMTQKLGELQAKISLLQANDEKCETFLLQINQLQNNCSVLQESLKEKDNIILQLESATSILETDHQYSVEQMNDTIKQLRVEREQLMLQAQERVAATEAKCRENTLSLNEKISELQSKETEIENLRIDIEKLSAQLDESLIVAEANQSAAAQELSALKACVNASQKELEECVKAHSAREAELANQVKSLKQENLCLEVNRKKLETLENEKRTLLQKVKSLEEKIERDSAILTEIQSLKEEKKTLQNELESLAALQKDNELLLSKVHSLASNEKDLHEKLNVLESTNIELRTSIPQSLQQSSQTDNSSVNKDVTQLQDENRALLDKISVLEETISQDTGNQFEKYINLIKRDYEGKLEAKEVEMESKLKQIIKDFAAQINLKEKDYDEILSQVMERSQNQEGKLLREHRLEISSLRQEVFEKDCAMDEMHDHYEELMKVKKKEKDAKLMELEKKCGILSSAKPGSDPTNACNDTSDWDDNWAECDEHCEKSSPIHGGKSDCASHVQQIRVLQEELEKCNSELKDLKVLLRLTPPMSHASTNNSANSSLLLPEPTEFEYLKNILFEYMMGKEQLTLAKVIAAVLRFSDEQTKLVLRKEELKQTAK